ncbi:response regulator transcription factor [Streptomyces sp. NPDC059761]|uniref:response regulator transcription factor n=1 Tax=Streptomyces sp. NPDC059761 TaxID=3346937 RepID=UPI003658FE2F
MRSKKLGSGLSPRETSIVQLACRGNTDGTIARRLGISVHTVRDYWRYSIKPALGAVDRFHAVALAVKQGLVDPDGQVSA